MNCLEDCISKSIYPKKENKAIKNPECICFNCLEESTVHTIQIPQMGYGSGFDGLSTKIQLCNECYSQTNPRWWKLEEIPIKEFENDFSRYKYEDEIFNFVKQMPLAGQELFWNHYAYSGYSMKAQDWIDYELGTLSKEKYKEYGLL